MLLGVIFDNIIILYSIWFSSQYWEELFFMCQKLFICKSFMERKCLEN